MDSVFNCTRPWEGGQLTFSIKNFSDGIKGKHFGVNSNKVKDIL